MNEWLNVAVLCVVSTLGDCNTNNAKSGQKTQPQNPMFDMHFTWICCIVDFILKNTI